MYQEELFSYLKSETAKIDAAMRADLAGIKDTSLAELIEYALFNGGKRIRPLLCVLAARLCDAAADQVFRLAIAFEYLHVASLLHDDVIDRAEQRRGRRPANLVWGRTPAILAGDYLHARSMYLIGKSTKSRGLEIICQVTAAMVEGEFRQLHNVHDFNQSEKDYFAVIEGKTAMLIAAVCEIGALFATDYEKRITALKSYGADLGAAFQITDDLLDYQGDPQKTGKAVGNDFCEGKMTLPLIHALENSSPSDHDFIMNLLAGEPEERRRSINRVTNLLDRYQGFDYARRQAEKLTERAIAGLEVFQDARTMKYKNILTGLAHFVLNRRK